jgi:hypothetical protein
MASTATVTVSITYTPPSAPANSGTVSLSVPVSCDAQNVGQIDIPASTAPSTALNIPFGSVNSARIILVKNLTSQELVLKMNGSLAISNIAANGELCYVCPIDPLAVPLSSVSLTTTAAFLGPESIQYWVFGT